MKKQVRESSIETSLFRHVKAQGGWAIKLVSPGARGVPDRMILAPGGKICFVEVKAPGRKPTPLQKKRHEQLSDLGHIVYVLDSYESVKSFASEFFRGE